MTTVTDLRQARDAAREIAAAALGRDPGPMATVESSSHHVYVSPDVVVKIIDAAGHSRLRREIALAPHLPAGLTAPLLGTGLYRLGAHEFRYTCYKRVPGAVPGMGMPGVDGVTARLLTEQAVQQLNGLHGWIPAGHAERTLSERLDHGGFVSQSALFAEVENLATLNRDGTVPRRLIDGLMAIAERAPLQARAVVPVHADCHWGNWVVSDQSVTALLDFERARFGEPADDWFFLARFSGPTRRPFPASSPVRRRSPWKPSEQSARFVTRPISCPTFALRSNALALVPRWLLTGCVDLRNSSPGGTGGGPEIRWALAD